MRPTQKPRQRQRLKRRMILLMLGSFIIAATVVTTIVINTTQVAQTKAKSEHKENYFLVEDQSYSNTFSLPAPIIRKNIPPAEGTLLVKKLSKADADNSAK